MFINDSIKKFRIVVPLQSTDQKLLVDLNLVLTLSKNYYLTNEVVWSNFYANLKSLTRHLNVHA